MIGQRAPRRRYVSRMFAGAVLALAALGASIAGAVPGGSPAATVGTRAERLGNPVEIPVERFVPPRRAIMVSDSVLAGIDVYDRTDHLTGARWFTDYGICRRLITTSCKATGSPRPPTLVQELSSLPFVPDRYDLFVVATGYNDSAWVLSTYWDQIVAAIRDAGFEHIAWLNYRTAMGGSVGRNGANLNAILYDRAAGEPDIVVWDFDGFTFGQPWFVSDRTHLSPSGAAHVADWLSHLVATVNVAG